jgi:hypothetical protein
MYHDGHDCRTDLYEDPPDYRHAGPAQAEEGPTAPYLHKSDDDDPPPEPL